MIYNIKWISVFRGLNILFVSEGYSALLLYATQITVVISLYSIHLDILDLI